MSPRLNSVVMALTQAIQSDPHTRRRYFCSRYHRDSALHPFIVATGSVQRGERRLDAPTLAVGNQSGQNLAEIRVLGARMDVLPAIGGEEGGLDRPRFFRRRGAPAFGHEIGGIGCG